ncbi:MAG TPA: type II toxin-antitoxin system ParD family antitoxin [Ensifer sp.]|nr:type II toxin-antitoxin system ParD family antitoxin [Ensifer sp.]
MSKSVSIHLDAKEDAFIERQIATGRFGSTDEVVKAALELLQDEEAELDAIRQALIEGEESGVAEEFDFDEFLKWKQKEREQGRPL